MFYGIGVGPGDSELLTIKAKNIIEKCDVIFAPKTSVDSDCVALKIAMPYILDNKQIVTPIFPMTYDIDELEKAWDIAAAEIVDLLKIGKTVAFLTLGDPMVYSTYIFMLKRISIAGYTTETIPAVTSFCAAASRISRPLAMANEKIAIIPSAYECEDLENILNTFENIVLMKVSKNYDSLVGMLKKNGLLKYSVLISRCGLPEENIEYNLENLVGTKINYLSMIIVNKNSEV